MPVVCVAQNKSGPREVPRAFEVEDSHGLTLEHNLVNTNASSIHRRLQSLNNSRALRQSHTVFLYVSASSAGAAMKLICAIVLVFGLLMFRDGIVLGLIIALFFALAVSLAFPLLDELSEMVERGTSSAH